MKSIHECRTVLELLQDKNRWTKGTPYRDKNNEPVFSNSPNIAAFCLIGAMTFINEKEHEGKFEEYFEMRVKLRKCINEEKSVSFWNDEDETTHDMVLDAVRKAGI